MDKLCHICGAFGHQKTIVTCRICKDTHEHAYCMPNFNGSIPLNWTCEDCELRRLQGVNSSKTLIAKESAGATTKFPINSFQGRIQWERKVDKGRTKYISAQEAIRLSSGIPTQPPRTSSALGIPPRHKASAISRLSLLKPNAVPEKISPPRAKTSLPFKSSGDFKQPREKQQTSQPSKKFTELGQASNELKGPGQVSKERTEMAYRKKYAAAEQPLKAVRIPGKVAGSSSILIAKPPRAVSGDNVAINEKHGDVVSEDRNLMNIPPQVVKNLRTDPALHPSWKGSFILPNCMPLGSMLHKNEFLAHPPSRVPYKVYNFSTKMPQALEFSLLPCQDIWGQLFLDDIPNNEDIGLYFFPSSNFRNERYTILVEFLAGGNLVMRSCINGVELFIFPSVLLSVDYREWNGNFFLWGLFRRVKTVGDGNEEIRKLVLLPCPSIVGDENNKDDEVAAVNSREKNTISPNAQISSSVAGKEISIYIPRGYENYKLIIDSPEACRSNTSGERKNIHMKRRL